MNYTDTQGALDKYFDINSIYYKGNSNQQIGLNRKRYSLMLCARLGIIAPVLIIKLYGIDQRTALIHLNKLVDEGLLSLVNTSRSVDNRVYVLTYTGAKYASEIMDVDVYFRSQKDPSRLVNFNSINHDLMLGVIIVEGLHRKDKHQQMAALWDCFVSEREYKRIFKSVNIRNVDGLVKSHGSNKIAAIEMEHSYKSIQQRETILQKYLFSLKEGIYDKIFLFSHKPEIFADIKRLHNQIFDASLHHHNSKKSPSFTEDDIELLKDAIIFRTIYCDILQKTFYS